MESNNDPSTREYCKLEKRHVAYGVLHIESACTCTEHAVAHRVKKIAATLKNEQKGL